ncbi:MAG TPA: glutamate--tRNA ligase [Clostridiales bacterium]|nr:MAG: glutamate--tRNA ligase [Clostridiales bacterium GWD2_32_59]HAN10392.1 glutamate--tRNA ligase [Clostridiales bacterium]
MEVRTRFAPSPTGFMHVGNIRSALYTYLIAKKHEGTFILRIEDTDQNRYVEGAVEKIYKDLKNLGFIWQEGPDVGGDYGPYTQSERKPLYMEYAKKLIKSGHAYYCFCAQERLDDLRNKYAENNMTFMYDGICRGVDDTEADERIKNGEAYVIRFKMPRTGTTSYDDVIYGKLTFKNSELDDIILIKSDGLPTYNFANVVDDYTMKISHVVRGNEYISSTPKYKLVYDAFGFEMPKIVHLPMVNKPDGSGKKLGKRDGDVTFDSLLDKGYLKEAIINFMALLGWSPGGENEIFSLKELEENFSIDGISKSPAVYDQVKLNWMNGLYIRKEDIEYITELSIPFIVDAGFMTERQVKEKREWIKKVVSAVRGNVEYLAQIPEHIGIFFGDTVTVENDEAKEVLIGEHVPTVLKAFKAKVENIDEVNEDFTKGVFKEIQNETGIKGKNLFMTIRVALTGQCHGPEMPEILQILGKEMMIKRLKKAIKE